METCYRHPDRETAVRCANCGRPICPDCMRTTPVGVRCPECAGERSRVSAAGFTMGRDPVVTYALLATNIGVFLATNQIGGGGGGLFGSGGSLNSLGRHLSLFGPAVADGQYYRLITAAFVHYGPIHLAFNMYALYLIGGALERYVGHWRFAVIYLLSALAGSFGALLVSPDALTAGASGAIFGLMGALLVLERHRGVALLGGSIGGLLLINLVFTFGVPGISVGGHIGGLIGGIATGIVLSGYGRGHLAYGRLTPLMMLGLAGIAVGTVAGSLAVAGG
jgi:membrane associated rhomboid family serine protease